MTPNKGYSTNGFSEELDKRTNREQDWRAFFQARNTPCPFQEPTIDALRDRTLNHLHPLLELFLSELDLASSQSRSL